MPQLSAVEQNFVGLSIKTHQNLQSIFCGQHFFTVNCITGLFHIQTVCVKSPQAARCKQYKYTTFAASIPKKKPPMHRGLYQRSSNISKQQGQITKVSRMPNIAITIGCAGIRVYNKAVSTLQRWSPVCGCCGHCKV